MFSTAIVPADNTTWPRIEQGLKVHGWTEYFLPDSSVYYTNAALRVITDIDLRNKKKLEAVSNAFERKGSREPALAPPPEGWELWLREGAGKLSYDLALLKAWVNHKARVLTLQAPLSAAEAIERISEEDSKYIGRILGMAADWSLELDMEHRYWTFMESHPAHAPLPENASTEAMDTLTWCYTGKLCATKLRTHLI